MPNMFSIGLRFGEYGGKICILLFLHIPILPCPFGGHLSCP